MRNEYILVLVGVILVITGWYISYLMSISPVDVFRKNPDLNQYCYLNITDESKQMVQVTSQVYLLPVFESQVECVDRNMNIINITDRRYTIRDHFPYYTHHMGKVYMKWYDNRI